MMKSDHTFLSSVCIASVHWDIVRRKSQEEFLESRGITSAIKAETTHLIRAEVMDLISHEFDNTEAQVSDLNIMAVLHIMASDIILCDDAALEKHEEGMLKMVLLRGGLQRLGFEGQLATLLMM